MRLNWGQFYIIGGILFLTSFSALSGGPKNTGCATCDTKQAQGQPLSPESLKVAENFGEQLSPSTHLTGYYPFENAMEGGFTDRYGDRLYTLQEFLNGKAPYVSVALDYLDEMKVYHDRKNPVEVCIPGLDQAYRSEMNAEVLKKTGGVIRFRIVDTGKRFKHKKWAKLDVCVGGKELPRATNEKYARDDRLNRNYAIYRCGK